MLGRWLLAGSVVSLIVALCSAVAVFVASSDTSAFARLTTFAVAMVCCCTFGAGAAVVVDQE